MLKSKLRLAQVEILEKHLNLDKLGAVLGDDVAEKFFSNFYSGFSNRNFCPRDLPRNPTCQGGGAGRGRATSMRIQPWKIDWDLKWGCEDDIQVALREKDNFRDRWKQRCYTFSPFNLRKVVSGAENICISNSFNICISNSFNICINIIYAMLDYEMETRNSSLLARSRLFSLLFSITG